MADLDATPTARQVSTGSKVLFWGLLLAVVGVLLVAGGSGTSDDVSSTAQDAAQLGWLCVGLAAPLVLIGCIAVGVRIGMQDRDRG